MSNDVDDFLAYIAGDRAYSPATVTTYAKSLAAFEQYFRLLDDQLTWENVDTDVIRRWMMHEMHRGIDSRTMAKELSALRAIYRYLLRMGRIEKDPVRVVRNPKIHRKLPTFIKQSEMDRLLDGTVFPSTYEGLRDHTILLTFYSTGVRVSELVGLNLRDVDTAQGELKVTGKRNKQRIIPFGDDLRQALQDYKAELEQFCPEAEALFVNSRGRRITADQVRSMVKFYLSLVTTQKKKSPHVLRHTFATVMLNNGADIEAIKELLGHESIATTEVYTHVTFAELKKEYEQAHPRA